MKLRLRALDLAARWVLGLSICAGGMIGVAAAAPLPVDIAGNESNDGEDVAEEIRSALTSFDSITATNPRAAEIVAFYERRDFEPAWTGSSEALDRARQVVSILRRAGEQGLRRSDYAVAASNGSLATFDIGLTASLLRYARDVRTGRVSPGQVYQDVSLVPQQYDAASALAAALRRNALAEYLVKLPPQHAGYVALANALARYGQAGPSGLTAFRAQQIAANMERWRWLPRVLGDRYIAVDVPDQSLEYVRNGQPVLKSRVVIGRRNTPTPILETTVNAVIANPPWWIPDDIAARMIAPHESEPGYLAAKNIVFENGQYRQNPGPGNGLGLLVLDAPNPFWVYMHDTPSKNLFQSSVREFSNGCVRVQEIFNLASLALTDDVSAGLPELQQSIDTGSTQRLPLSSPLAVYMLYWTAHADENGAVQFRPDRYGRDPPLIAALGFRPETPASSDKPTQPMRPKPKPIKRIPGGQADLHAAVIDAR